MSNTHLPNYLRSHRKQHGLSQRDVAHLLGSGTRAKVSGYERFKRTPSLATALKLQAIFKKPVSEIFEGLYKEAEQAVVHSAKATLEKPDKHTVTSESPRRRKIEELADSLTHEEHVPF